MDLAHRSRPADIKRNIASVADAEQNAAVDDERDSYELSFEEEQDIVDSNNDDDEDSDDEDDAGEPVEWRAVTSTTTTTSATDKVSGNQRVETLQQVSYLSVERRKGNVEKLTTSAAILSDIDPGAGGDSLSAVYGNTDDEDDGDDDNADEQRMERPSSAISRNSVSSGDNISITAVVADQNRGSDHNPNIKSPSGNNSADERQSHTSQNGDDEHEEDEYSEYANLEFLQSTDDEQPASSSRTAAAGHAAETAKHAKLESPTAAPVIAATDRPFQGDRQGTRGIINQKIGDAGSDSSFVDRENYDQASQATHFEPDANKNGRAITTPTNFSTMMRRRTVAAAEAEQQEKLQQHNRTKTDEQVDIDNIHDIDGNDSKLFFSSGRAEKDSKEHVSTTYNTDDTEDEEEQSDERQFLTRQTAATVSSLSAMSNSAGGDPTTRQTNSVDNSKSEILVQNQLSFLSPDTRMFAKNEQKSFLAAAENETSDHDGNKTEASTTTMQSDARNAGSEAAPTFAATVLLKAPSALAPKMSPGQLQNIDESDDAATGSHQQRQKSAIPLHAVKSRRVHRRGAPDSAMSSNSNSRATTSSSRRSTTKKKKSSSTELDEVGGGTDIYRQFKKLQNQYKSLQTRIQSGIKQHLQPASGMSEELDDLNVYKRGLHDKREHERAQRLTLLEKLKVELAKATSAIERLQQAPQDSRAKDLAKTALSLLAQQLGDAREMYRSLETSLTDQAKIHTNELKQCQDRLETYVKRIALDITQQEHQQNAPAKLGDNKHAISPAKQDKSGVNTKQSKTAKLSQKIDDRPVLQSTTLAEKVPSSSRAILSSVSAAKTTLEKPNDAKKTRSNLTKTSTSNDSALLQQNRSAAIAGHRKMVTSDNDNIELPSESLAHSSVIPKKKSRIQTRLAKGDLPDAVFEYRTFLEHNGGRNGVGWTELEHKAYVSARTKHLAFAPAPTGGNGDIEAADPTSTSHGGEFASINAMPINDERFYSDLAKELMIKTSKQVREHDEWYAHVQRLDAAQKQAVKAQKDAKRLQLEQKQKQLKEQQARQRLMAQKLREQAMQKWHEQTKQQVEQWRAHKTVQQKQKEEEQKFEKLVKTERQSKMRHKHEQIKQKVLMYRQQREQEAAAERERRDQAEQEERKQRSLQANRFLKLSANKSIQNVQQQRQKSKTFVEQRRAEKEERLQRLRSKVSVNVERDPQRLLEQTTAWKRRTGAGAAAIEKVPNASKNKKKPTTRNNGGGDAERSTIVAAASSSSEAESSSAESSSSGESSDEEDDEEVEDEKPAANAAPSVPASRRRPGLNPVSQKKLIKLQPTVLSSRASPQKQKPRPFVAGGLVRKTMVTKKTTTVTVI